MSQNLTLGRATGKRLKLGITYYQALFLRVRFFSFKTIVTMNFEVCGGGSGGLSCHVGRSAVSLGSAYTICQ